MSELQAKVLKAEYKPNCFILVSGTRVDPAKTHGCFFAEPHMSFFYDAGENAAEWEPRHGPIQCWHKCSKDDESATPHYFYDFTDSPGCNWSQLAVERRGLPEAFVRGDYDYIFGVLEEWTNSR